MGRFIFTLDPVLKQRLREEERAQQELAERERERQEIERVVRRIESRMREAQREWRDRLLGTASGNATGMIAGGAVDVREVRMQAGSTIREMAELKRTVLTLASAQRRVAEARAALLHAARSRLAIQDLRERRWNEWRAERGRSEQRTLDDLVVMGHGRAASDEQGAW